MKKRKSSRRDTVTKKQLLEALKAMPKGSSRRSAKSYGDNPKIRHRERSTINMQEYYEVKYALKNIKKRKEFPYHIVITLGGYLTKKHADKEKKKALSKFRGWTEVEAKVLSGTVKRKAVKKRKKNPKSILLLEDKRKKRFRLGGTR